MSRLRLYKMRALKYWRIYAPLGLNELKALKSKDPQYFKVTYIKLILSEIIINIKNADFANDPLGTSHLNSYTISANWCAILHTTWLWKNRAKIIFLLSYKNTPYMYYKHNACTNALSMYVAILMSTQQTVKIVSTHERIYVYYILWLGFNQNPLILSP